MLSMLRTTGKALLVGHYLVVWGALFELCSLMCQVPSPPGHLAALSMPLELLTEAASLVIRGRQGDERRGQWALRGRSNVASETGRWNRTGLRPTQKATGQAHPTHWQARDAQRTCEPWQECNLLQYLFKQSC